MTPTYSLDPGRLQWGHDRAVVELFTADDKNATTYPLQWGHDRAVVELAPTPGTQPQHWWLQWGHDRAVVELRSHLSGRRQADRFNGATTARSWNFARVKLTSIIVSSFNGATTARSWNY